jgi:hypothetical protein
MLVAGVSRLLEFELGKLHKISLEFDKRPTGFTHAVQDQIHLWSLGLNMWPYPYQNLSNFILDSSLPDPGRPPIWTQETRSNTSTADNAPKTAKRVIVRHFYPEPELISLALRAHADCSFSIEKCSVVSKTTFLVVEKSLRAN